MQEFGIDISHWQGNFDFNRAKSEGVKFVILKAGGGDFGLYKDSKFESNYKKAKEAGLGVGAYFFGYAFSVEEAENEANKFLSIIDGKQFDYPVYYDVEGKMIDKKKSKNDLTDAVVAFCEKVEKAGYFVGIYSGESAFGKDMDARQVSRFAKWIARWTKKRPATESGMWQFGGEKNFLRSNKIAGVVCDQDYCYVDYPALIKEKKLNGYDKEVVPVVKEEPKPKPTGYKVSVTTKCLNVRTGPGTNYPKTGKFTGVGIFTIVETKPGTGSKAGWGRMETGGWISLDFAKRV